MKVANIIVAHKNPQQLQQLLRQYSNNHFKNWIHVDKRIDVTPYKVVTAQSNTQFMSKRIKVAWAGNSFVRVVLNGFEEVLQDKSVGYVNVMSGLDFPIKSTAQFYDLLANSFESGKSEYLDICDLSSWPYNGKQISDRFERYHLSDWTRKGRYFTERIINAILPRRQFYGGKMVPYGRSAWFTATRDFAQYSLDFFRDNPDYFRFLQFVWASDEFAFSSLVMNSPFREKVYKHHLRYIDWSERKASPKTFTVADLDALLNSDRFIARKFDATIDNNVIDAIETELLKKKVTPS
jgi:hypothetical protein